VLHVPPIPPSMICSSNNIWRSLRSFNVFIGVHGQIFLMLSKIHYELSQNQFICGKTSRVCPVLCIK